VEITDILITSLRPSFWDTNRNFFRVQPKLEPRKERAILRNKKKFPPVLTFVANIVTYNPYSYIIPETVFRN